MRGEGKGLSERSEFLSVFWALGAAGRLDLLDVELYPSWDVVGMWEFMRMSGLWSM